MLPEGHFNGLIKTRMALGQVLDQNHTKDDVIHCGQSSIDSITGILQVYLKLKHITLGKQKYRNQMSSCSC